MVNSPVTIKTHIFNIKYRTLYVLKRYIKRVLVRNLNLNRMGNYPYITGDGFRSLAQHVYDESSDVIPHKVEHGDIIFLNPDFIESYFKERHPLIRHKYILISSNSDLGIEKKHTALIDEKIARWFAKNILYSHEKITPIPIGLTNTFLNKIGKTSDMSFIRKENLFDKQPGISYGFSLASGTERINLLEQLKKLPFAYNVFEKTQLAYFKKMAQYSFVASPEGNGADCHRTWEALYLKCIPIAKKNYFINHFKELGLPILTIDTWEEIESFNEAFLEEQYESMKHLFDNKILFMDYWINLIMEEKKKLFV